MQLRALDDDHERRGATQPFALHHVLVGEDIGKAVLGSHHHPTRHASDLATDQDFHADALP